MWKHMILMVYELLNDVLVLQYSVYTHHQLSYLCAGYILMIGS